MKRITILCLILLSALFAACSLPFGPSQPAQPDGYLAQTSGGVYWIQWTENNGQLTGTYDVYEMNPQTHTYENVLIPITGTRKDNQMNIIMDIGSVKVPASGTLNTTTLTLSSQDTDSGQTDTLTLTGSSTSNYQKVLSDFKAHHP